MPSRFCKKRIVLSSVSQSPLPDMLLGSADRAVRSATEPDLSEAISMHRVSKQPGLPLSGGTAAGYVTLLPQQRSCHIVCRQQALLVHDQ
jgi:hypothetical protein